MPHCRSTYLNKCTYLFRSRMLCGCFVPKKQPVKPYRETAPSSPGLMLQWMLPLFGRRVQPLSKAIRDPFLSSSPDDNFLSASKLLYHECRQNI